MQASYTHLIAPSIHPNRQDWFGIGIEEPTLLWLYSECTSAFKGFAKDWEGLVCLYMYRGIARLFRSSRTCRQISTAAYYVV